jgi:hypothetical protein
LSKVEDEPRCAVAEERRNDARAERDRDAARLLPQLDHADVEPVDRLADRVELRVAEAAVRPGGRRRLAS